MAIKPVDSIQTWATGDQVLTETDFATHANWNVTGDFDDTGGNAAYTHSSGVGTLTQPSAAFAVAAEASKSYTLTYTVSGFSGDADASITTAFASVSTDLNISNGTHNVVFTSAVSPGDFVISATSTSGGFTLDDLSLDGGVELQDPGASYRKEGWIGGNAAPAKFANFVLQKFGEWQTYFDAQVDENVTSIGTNTTDIATNASDIAKIASVSDMHGANYTHIEIDVGADAMIGAGYAGFSSATLGVMHKIAYGQSGVLYSTADGFDAGWGLRTTPVATQLESHAYDGTTAVVVGQTETVITTTNGSTYTSRTTPGTDFLHSVIFNGTNFIACGAASKVITSPAGTTWASKTTPNANDLYAIAQNKAGTKIMAVGDAGESILSIDNGDTWSDKSSGALNWGGIAYLENEQLWVRVQRAGTTIEYSDDDGTTWTTAAFSLPDTTYTNNGNLCATDGTIIVATVERTIATIVDPTIATGFALGDMPNTLGGDIRSINFNENRFFAGTDNEDIYISLARRPTV